MTTNGEDIDHLHERLDDLEGVQDLVSYLSNG